MRVNKMSPKAEIFLHSDEECFNNYYDIRYVCPECGKRLKENVVACDECGIFFDWTLKAHIRMIPTIEWR